VRQPGSSWPGFLVVLIGLALSLLGNLASIPDVVTYGMLIIVAGLILQVCGWREGLRYWPAWAYLLFLLPLPNFIYWQLSIRLQFISSELGVMLIKMLGIPVFLDGNIIDLGVYKLQVAEACNGLRYLFPLLSFGYLFAVLYRGPRWHKLLLFIVAVPITILMNSLRIGIVGVMVNQYGISQAEGFIHLFEGWVIFAACIGLLYGLAYVLQRFTAEPKSVLQVLDLDTHGFGAIGARLLSYRTHLAVWLSAAAIALAALFWAAIYTPKVSYPDRLRFQSFPDAVSVESATWRGEREILDADIQAVLKADDYLVSTYVAPTGGNSVNLLIAYYRSQVEGAGIHSPEVCLPAGGWEVSGWAGRAVSVDGGFTVNRAIIQKGVNRQLVYYWFEQRGRRVTSDYAAKAYTVWDSVRSGRTDGALVRVVTPIQGSDVEGADTRLASFLAPVLKDMPQYVPR
jgi:exosortase D (VPLPA-CTERM-specific)